MQEQKKRPAMPGAGRPATAEKQFLNLEKQGLNPTLSMFAQNVIEFDGDSTQVLNRIKYYQPEFLGAVKNILK